MNDRHAESIGLDDPARSAIVRAAAGALFVGMLLGIGASALGRSDATPERAAPPTPYSADHAKITNDAEPASTF